MSSFIDLPVVSTVFELKNDKLHIGIGWDPKNGTVMESLKSTAEELISGVSSGAYDMNIAAIVKHDGESDELVFFGHKLDKSEAIKYLYDNRTGGKKGEDEGIDINLSKLPENVTEIILFAIVYEGQSQKHYFQNINNFFVQVKDPAVDKVIYRNDTDVYLEAAVNQSAYVFGTVKKFDGGWIFESLHRISDHNTEGDLFDAMN